MKKGLLRLAAALAAALLLAGCHPIRGFRVGAGFLDTTHRLVGHVCEIAEEVYDEGGVLWGVRFVAAVLGQPCDTGGREINVPATLEREVRKARGLQIGQGVDIDGDLAQRDPDARVTSLAATADPRDLNEPAPIHRFSSASPPSKPRSPRSSRPTRSAMSRRSASG